MSLWFRVLFVCGVLGAAGFCAQAIDAQTRTVSGTVQDPSGALVPGATVQVLTERGDVIGHTISDSSGVFHVQAPARGRYVLDVTETGFREVKQPLSANGTRVKVVLAVAAADEVVTVEGSDSSAQVSTEIGQNQNGNTVDRDALDQLPVFDEDYIATLSRFLNPDATGTNGVTLVVNGIEANGPGVTPSAVTSVKINQNPYSALFSRPGRARIEITTAGGTPQLHGSANFMYRNSVFDAKRPFAKNKPNEERTYYEGSLTGPLARNGKTTFLLALDDDSDNQQSVVVAALPTGQVNETAPYPVHHYFLSGRGFHNYGKGDQFWIGYSYEHRTVENQGVGGNVLPEAGTNAIFFEHEVNVADTHVLSPTLVNQIHFLIGHYDSKTQSINDEPQIAVSGAFVGGGAQADIRRTEYHTEGTEMMTWTRGTQEIKFGMDVPDISRRGYDDFTNLKGTYSFASLAAYESDTPYSYVVQQGNGHVTFLEKNLAGVFEDTVRMSAKLQVAAGVRYYWQNYFGDSPRHVAPRLSFAYAPWKQGHTVIRGGGGIFFDRSGPSPLWDLRRFNGVQLRRYLVEDPGYPATQAEIAAEPTSVVTLDPRARIPYSALYGVGVEQQLTARSSLAVNYSGARGIDSFRSVDANAPMGATAARPNAALGQNRQIQSEGSMKSNSLEVNFRGRIGTFFTGQAQYVLSKTYNNTSGVTYFPANSYAPNADWARSDNDRRQKFDLLGSFNVREWFRFGTALSTYSGMPVNVTTGNDDNHDGLALDRPAGVPRNSMHGPGYLDLDMNVSRDFALTRRKEKGPVATVAVNAFNVLNHQNDTTYVGVVTSPYFGRAVAAQAPRMMQLNVGVKF
ncbi:MAG TPA: carboxypeptidase-like regulatory domain-containing protein [Bryocella sp.]|nr:carboxypeptidase-like regulatory domain-containing protein [Bryocella sp.]